MWLQANDGNVGGGDERRGRYARNFSAHRKVKITTIRRRKRKPIKSVDLSDGDVQHGDERYVYIWQWRVLTGACHAGDWDWPIAVAQVISVWIPPFLPTLPTVIYSLITSTVRLLWDVHHDLWPVQYARASIDNRRTHQKRVKEAKKNWKEFRSKVPISSHLLTNSFAFLNETVCALIATLCSQDQTRHYLSRLWPCTYLYVKEKRNRRYIFVKGEKIRRKIKFKHKQKKTC